MPDEAKVTGEQVQEHLRGAIQQSHPELAASVDPATWAKILQALQDMIPIIINLFNQGK